MRTSYEIRSTGNDSVQGFTVGTTVPRIIIEGCR